MGRTDKYVDSSIFAIISLLMVNSIVVVCIDKGNDIINKTAVFFIIDKGGGRKEGEEEEREVKMIIIKVKLL